MTSPPQQPKNILKIVLSLSLSGPYAKSCLQQYADPTTTATKRAQQQQQEPKTKPPNMIKLFSLKQQKKDGEATPRTGNQKKSSAAQLRIQKGTFGVR